MAEAALFPDSGPSPVQRLLVVDDDRVSNRVIARRLAALGYQVESATSGEAALERLADARPDLMFLDVSMPGLSGLDVLERVRAQRLDVAVIMMTAYGSESIAIEALRRGADDYLRKPFEPTEFRVVLERVVQRIELGRQNAALRQELDESRRMLEAELARAGQVQAELLPRNVPTLPGFELAARCVPAREVGGDFYDWYQTAPDLLTLTLADVMGKGMPAALMMATVRATMRAVVRRSPPAEAMRYVTLMLGNDLDRAGGFVTLFLAQLEPATRRLRFVDAGHGLSFLRRADGTMQDLQPRGLPLGIALEDEYREGQLTFQPGDALILYSDGLIDARPDATLDPATIAASLDRASGAAEMVDRLVDLARPLDALPDDLTVLALCCQLESRRGDS